jgi:hypothetical protein
LQIFGLNKDVKIFKKSRQNFLVKMKPTEATDHSRRPSRVRAVGIVGAGAGKN